MNSHILIIGGYGVFGGRLTRALLKAGYEEVIVAGRRLAEAEAFCAAAKGGKPAEIDTSAPDLADRLAALAPVIVVDAAGPWQAYGEMPYRLAKAVMACGAHYLDLCDDAGFTAGIPALDGEARCRGLCVLSGVSSVPALSSAAVGALADGLTRIDAIDTMILPGNRAPRGRSVMASILMQAGRPLRVMQGGKWVSVDGWGRIRRARLEVARTRPLGNRWTSPIGAPDLTLMPERYGAGSVRFSAGLELKLLHGGLWALGRLVAAGLLPPLERATGTLKWIADRLAWAGSDRGGMRVEVVGRLPDGSAERRRWTLIVEAGDGPGIPAIPARIMIGKILAGEAAPGARACLGEFTLEEAETAMGVLHLSTGQTRERMQCVFREALGKGFDRLPAPLQALHDVSHVHHWRGEADVSRGGGLLARLAGALAGFPPEGRGVPVEVTMQHTEDGETWIRRVGKREFRSHLSHRKGDGPGIVHERFGLMRFRIPLERDGGRLAFPVSAGRVMGTPLPRFLLPVSETHESVAEDGSCRFDVSIRLPMIGLVAHYRGWLRPAACDEAARA